MIVATGSPPLIPSNSHGLISTVSSEVKKDDAVLSITLLQVYDAPKVDDARQDIVARLTTLATLKTVKSAILIAGVAPDNALGYGPRERGLETRTAKSGTLNTAVLKSPSARAGIEIPHDTVAKEIDCPIGYCE